MIFAASFFPIFQVLDEGFVYNRCQHRILHKKSPSSNLKRKLNKACILSVLLYFYLTFLYFVFQWQLDFFVSFGPVLGLIFYSFLFVVIVFIILMINKGISKAITYSGMGNLDKIFGFFFGFLKGYIIAVCVFATVYIIYNFKNCLLDLKKSFSFQWF